MKAVWKFPMVTNDYFSLKMPAGAKVLHVAEQADTPCMWALVDVNAPLEMRHFRFAGTGHAITEGNTELEHVGTFLVRNGALVFHIFEVK